MKRILALTCMLITSFSSLSDETRPSAGVEVDKTIIVGTRSVISSICVSVDAQGVSIVFDRSELEAWAKSNISGWRIEEERLQLIRATRARMLLEASSSSIDAFGCVILTTDKIKDGRYLISELLENGQVAIMKSAASRPEAAIAVRYYGMRCGPLCGRGEIMFSLIEGGMFYRIDWWVS